MKQYLMIKYIQSSILIINSRLMGSSICKSSFSHRTSKMSKIIKDYNFLEFIKLIFVVDRQLGRNVRMFIIKELNSVIFKEFNNYFK